ncbi:MAG: EamA family transporter [Bacteroidales bacterium]|nr:EamA family transporter [Bacteroidales bacterium]
MLWIALAIGSALCLGFYDVFKKISLRANNVLIVLMLNTVFSTALMSPIWGSEVINGTWGLGGTWHGHVLIIIKALIVLASWVLGYYAIKHLPLTIQGPINATRPVVVLVGALLIFGERLNWVQWIGILLGFLSLYMISRIGSKEGFDLRGSRWLWLSIGAMFLGAVSALYDKYLMRYYQPMDVLAWYSLYQCILMSATVGILLYVDHRKGEKVGGAFRWSWAIPCIALFLMSADLMYFYSLSYPDSMVSIISMIRRGSVIVSFLYGVFILHEKNIRAKTIDLSILLVSLIILIVGANLR